jgi:hypothetical protein
METGQLRDVTEEGCSTPGTGMIFFCATITTTSSYTMGTGVKEARIWNWLFLQQILGYLIELRERRGWKKSASSPLA